MTVQGGTRNSPSNNPTCSIVAHPDAGERREQSVPEARRTETWRSAIRFSCGPTTRVSDRHLTGNVRMKRGDQGIKTVWQTRWLVAVHLDPLVGLLNWGSVAPIAVM